MQSPVQSMEVMSWIFVLLLVLLVLHSQFFFQSDKKTMAMELIDTEQLFFNFYPFIYVVLKCMKRQL